jgi:hypothetical protein
MHRYQGNFMPSILNQYSYLSLTIAVLLLGLLAAWRVQGVALPIRIGLWLLLVFVLAVTLWVVRPRSSENYQNLADIDALIGNGKPTLLELYSEY